MPHIYAYRISCFLYLYLYLHTRMGMMCFWIFIQYTKCYIIHYISIQYQSYNGMIYTLSYHISLHFMNIRHFNVFHPVITCFRPSSLCFSVEYNYIVLFRHINIQIYNQQVYNHKLTLLYFISTNTKIYYRFQNNFIFVARFKDFD